VRTIGGTARKGYLLVRLLPPQQRWTRHTSVAPPDSGCCAGGTAHTRGRQSPGVGEQGLGAGGVAGASRYPSSFRRCSATHAEARRGLCRSPGRVHSQGPAACAWWASCEAARRRPRLCPTTRPPRASGSGWTCPPSQRRHMCRQARPSWRRSLWMGEAAVRCTRWCVVWSAVTIVAAHVTRRALAQAQDEALLRRFPVMPDDHRNYAATWLTLSAATGAMAVSALRGRGAAAARHARRATPAAGEAS
jgi:hypothetical protein